MFRAIHKSKRQRRGSIVVLTALMMVPLLAFVVFAVDYGFLLKVRADLQRSADAAALAAVQELVPAADGSQDVAGARDVVRAYVASNMDSTFQVLDSDIEVGRYDRATIYSNNIALLNSGTFDAVKVTLRRDPNANSSVTLFFAPVLGIQDSDVVATGMAILARPTMLRPGDGVLPFSVPENVWESFDPGVSWTIYGDGKLADDFGDPIPGDWGTVDIGAEGNSTSDLVTQMQDGLSQSDLDELYADGRIPNNTHIDGSQPVWLNADPGLSSGMKSGVEAIHGQQRIVPIYDTYGGAMNGNNLEFHVTKWGVVTVEGSSWGGAKNTYVKVTKSHTYDGDIRPKGDLSDSSGVIDGAFGAPALVE